MTALHTPLSDPNAVVPGNPSSDPSNSSKQSVALGSGSSNASSTSRTGKHPPGSTSPTPYEFLGPPELPDELGRLGTYRILGVLGVGGMGMVFKAEDPTLRRAVALKVMLPQVAKNPTAKARFLREARAQAAVEHDHVIAIHQVGEDRGVPFLAMPLLKGQTLGAVLKLTPTLPLPELLRIGRETAEGLNGAHEKGLVHRDIKPANIWLEGAKQRVKILDFGLARATVDAEQGPGSDEPVTKAGAAVGTPAYMSPEQARGLSVDHRTDIFSLGVLMYQMATGELPFKGGDVMAVLTALALTPPVPPIERNPELPPVVSDLILRLLGKSPDERPPNGDAIADEVRQIEDALFRPAPMAAPAPMYAQQPGIGFPAAPAHQPSNDPWADIDATDTGMFTPPTPAVGAASSKINLPPSGKTAPHAPAPVMVAIPAPMPVALPAPPKKNRAPLFIALGGILGFVLLGGLVWLAIDFARPPKGFLNVALDPDVPDVTVILKKDGTQFTVKSGETKLTAGRYDVELGPDWSKTFRPSSPNVTILEKETTLLTIKPRKK